MPRNPHSSPPPARQAALEALSLTLPGAKAAQGRDAQFALDAVLQKRDLSSQDRGLCTELFYGFLRLKGRIDFILAQHLKKPGGLPPAVSSVLGLAAYEILFLDGVPARASVNWAVEHIGQGFGKRLSGLANAVLRKIADNADAYADPAFYQADGASPSVFLSRYYACPEWIVDLWLAAYGRARCENYLSAQIAPAPSGLRVNFKRPDGKALFESLAQSAECLYARAPMLAFSRFPRDLDIRRMESDGRISRQSAAAGDALSRLSPETWPTPILDACCGRGGKTLHLLETVTDDVIAADTHHGRLRALTAECGRLGLPLLPRVRANAAKPPFGSGTAGPKTILLDAPCSGLGVLSRRPDAKYRRGPSDLASLASLQKEMLRACFAILPQGGLLVYLTCTINPAENEDQIASFLRNTSVAALEKSLDLDATHRLSEFFYGAIIRKA